MIVVTGAAGFIGSNMVSKLNDENFKDIVLVDDFSSESKIRNFEGKIYSNKIDRKNLISWIDDNHRLIQFIIHIGARTDTTEFNWEVLEELNLEYTKNIWKNALNMVCLSFTPHRQQPTG